MAKGETGLCLASAIVVAPVDWANLARELGVDAIEEVPSPIPAADIPGESESSPVSHFQAAEAPDIQAAEAQDTAIVEAEVVEEEAEPTEVPPSRDRTGTGVRGVWCRHP